MHQYNFFKSIGVSVKEFYLLLDWIAFRTISLSSIDKVFSSIYLILLLASS